VFVLEPRINPEKFAMSWKISLKPALAFVAIVWLSGNPARVLAQVQARPEAPPFDAARALDATSAAGRRRHSRWPFVRPEDGNEPDEPGDCDSGDRITDAGPPTA